jgi:hypothetical protein
MKLKYVLVIFISLFSTFLCEVNRLFIDTNVGQDKIANLCLIYTGKPDNVSYDKDEAYEKSPGQTSDFTKCISQIAKIWLNLYPVAPCLVDLNGTRSMFIIVDEENEKEEEGYYYPELYIHDGLMCTRFFFKKIPQIFYIFSLKKENEVQQAIIKANSSMRSENFPQAQTELKVILRLLEEQARPSNHIEELCDYIRENLAFNSYHYLQILEKGDPKLDEQVIEFKNIFKELKPIDNNFFRNLLYVHFLTTVDVALPLHTERRKPPLKPRWFSGAKAGDALLSVVDKSKKEEAPKAFDYLLKAAKLDRGDRYLTEQFIRLNLYRDAQVYLTRGYLLNVL